MHRRADPDPIEASAIPTVLLVGEASCLRAPDFLRLGSVVVIAPSAELLRAWQASEETRRLPVEGSRSDRGSDDIVVDLREHAIRWRGRELDLTELEYRVLAALGSQPGAAWTFRDLRRAGWGSSHDALDDVMPVRSVIQRIRNKLRAAGVSAQVESVRGFGFRLRTIESGHRDASPILRTETSAAS